MTGSLSYSPDGAYLDASGNHAGAGQLASSITVVTDRAGNVDVVDYGHARVEGRIPYTCACCPSWRRI